jgi:hypothetical protein
VPDTEFRISMTTAAAGPCRSSTGGFDSHIFLALAAIHSLARSFSLTHNSTSISWLHTFSKRALNDEFHEAMLSLTDASRVRIVSTCSLLDLFIWLLVPWCALVQELRMVRRNPYVVRVVDKRTGKVVDFPT